MMSAISCSQADIPALSAIRRVYGEDFAIATIAAWIINVQDFFNVTSKMSDTQIEETAYMILDDFWALNLADIHLVFRRAKTGYYGPLYGRIDGSVIMTWFSEYFEERCECCARQTVAQANVLNSEHPVTDWKVANYVMSLQTKKTVKRCCNKEMNL